MQFWDALLYPFQERNASTRLMTALLVALIPLVGFFALKGWEYEISIRVRHRADELIPPWNDFSVKLRRGIVIQTAGFIYRIPTLILGGISLALWAVLLTNFLRSEVRDFETFTGFYLESAPTRFTLFIISLIYTFIANSILWNGYFLYIQSGRFWSFFDFLRILPMLVTNIWYDILAGLYIWLVGAVLWVGGAILSAAAAAFLIGFLLGIWLIPAFNLVVSSVFNGHILGQLSRDALSSIPTPRRRRRRHA